MTSDLWIAGSAASCHMTHKKSNMCDIRPPPPSREDITIGDKCSLKVEFVGNIDIEVHGYTDPRITSDVSYIPGLGLIRIPCRQLPGPTWSSLILEELILTKVSFPRNISGSYLNTTRLPARTVGVKRNGMKYVQLISLNNSITQFRLFP